MRYRVKSTVTISTNVDILNDVANLLLAEYYPKVGETFSGVARYDTNGNRVVCGEKTILSTSYVFCVARNSVEPVIFNIPINGYTLMAAGLIAFLAYKAFKNK
jgi:hypothetical protein